MNDIRGYNLANTGDYSYKDLSKLVLKSSYNRGELTLSNGKFGVMNGHVVKTGQNSDIPSTIAENVRVRQAVYTSIKNDVEKNGGGGVDPNYLNYVRESLFGGDRLSDSLSRDEAGILLKYRNRTGAKAMSQMRLEFRKIAVIKQTGQLADKGDAGLIKGLGKLFHHGKVLELTVNKAYDSLRHTEWNEFIESNARFALDRLKDQLGGLLPSVFENADAKRILLTHLKAKVLEARQSPECPYKGFGTLKDFDLLLEEAIDKDGLKGLGAFAAEGSDGLKLIAESGIDVFNGKTAPSEERLHVLAGCLRKCEMKPDADSFERFQGIRDLALAQLGEDAVNRIVGATDIYGANDAKLGELCAGLLSALADRNTPKGFAKLVDILVGAQKITKGERDALIGLLDKNKALQDSFEKTLVRLADGVFRAPDTELPKDLETVGLTFAMLVVQVPGFAQASKSPSGGVDELGCFLKSFTERMGDPEALGSFVSDSIGWGLGQGTLGGGEITDRYLHPSLIEFKDRAEVGKIKIFAGFTEERFKAIGGYDPQRHTHLAAIFGKIFQKDESLASLDRNEAVRNAKAPFLRYQYELLEALFERCNGSADEADRLLSDLQNPAVEDLKIEAFVNSLNYGNTTGLPRGEVEYDTPFGGSTLTPDGVVTESRKKLLRQLTLPTVKKDIRKLGLLENLDGDGKSFKELCDKVTPGIKAFAELDIIRNASDGDIKLLIEKKVDIVSALKECQADLRKQKLEVRCYDYLPVFMSRLRAGDSVSAANKAVLDLVRFIPDEVGLHLDPKSESDRAFGQLFDKLKLRMPELLENSAAGMSKRAFLNTLITTLRAEFAEKILTKDGAADRKLIARFVKSMVSSSELLSWADRLYANGNSDAKEPSVASACTKLVKSALKIRDEVGNVQKKYKDFQDKFKTYPTADLINFEDAEAHVGLKPEDLTPPGRYDLLSNPEAISKRTGKIMDRIGRRLEVVARLEARLLEQGITEDRKAVIKAALTVVLNAGQDMFADAKAADRIVEFIEKTAVDLQAAVNRLKSLPAGSKEAVEEAGRLLFNLFAGMYNEVLNLGVRDGSLFARGDIPDAPRVRPFVRTLMFAALSVKPECVSALRKVLAASEEEDEFGVVVKSPVLDLVNKRLEQASLLNSQGVQDLIGWVSQGKFGQILHCLNPQGAN